MELVWGKVGGNCLFASITSAGISTHICTKAADNDSSGRGSQLVYSCALVGCIFPQHFKCSMREKMWTHDKVDIHIHESMTK